jgi:phytoene dehydrogenase-like protein
MTTGIERYDSIIIGAGHNGLVTAAYLAKAGKKVLVLERRPIIGGIAATEEIYPGFKFPACAHLAGAFAEQIIGDLALRQYGLELLPLDPHVFAPQRDRSGLTIPSDPGKAAVEIGRFSKNDGKNFASFCALAKNLASFLRTLYGVALPDQGSRQNVNIRELVKVGWRFHRLGEKEMYEFLRILPMSLADLLNEWFEAEPLKAVIAGAALLGCYVGPRQQGTSFLFLHQQLGASNGALRSAGLVRGGIGNLPAALARAAEHHGADVRTDAEVARIVTRNGAATGVALRNGDEIDANVVISSADVKTTFQTLLEPSYLDPHFLLQVKNIRARGTLAKVNLALDTLPQFSGAESGKELGGVIHIGPTLDYLERAADDAKYGRFSKQPFLEITIPTVRDPSLAPEEKHVMSIWMQYAPYDLRQGNWHGQREVLGDTVVSLIEEYAPGFKNSILHRQVLTPLDLQQVFGLTGGHIHHAEMALDQIFFMRPLPGWARYGTPVRNLYLCGSGTHPGGGVTGLTGYYAAREILQRLGKTRK